MVCLFLSPGCLNARPAPISLRDLVIVTSPSNSVCRFSFDTVAGQSYPIEVTGNLREWTLLTNVAGAGGTVTISDEQPLNSGSRFYHVGIAPKAPIPIANMVFINPGTFTMGSPDTEVGHDAKEGPQTVVTLTRGFWIGKYEVTQAEDMTVTGARDSFFYGDLLPVDFMTWSGATNYCQKLTQTESAAGRLPAGYRYRLPTEAEWEYASRAGTTTPFGVGNGISLSSTQANFDGGFPYGGAPTGPFLNSTTIRGTYAPNAWGLCDMHGNVWEWCQDLYGPYPGGSVTDPKGATTGSTRVLRGGGFTSVGHSCRSAKRDARSITYANFGQGFRVVLAADP
jgi:formylglycine-generating enzyme required for sulfatase activity